MLMVRLAIVSAFTCYVIVDDLSEYICVTMMQI
jgi:hypothetical protein